METHQLNISKCDIYNEEMRFYIIKRGMWLQITNGHIKEQNDASPKKINFLYTFGSNLTFLSSDEFKDALEKNKILVISWETVNPKKKTKHKKNEEILRSINDLNQKIVTLSDSTIRKELEDIKKQLSHLTDSLQLKNPQHMQQSNTELNTSVSELNNKENILAIKSKTGKGFEAKGYGKPGVVKELYISPNDFVSLKNFFHNNKSFLNDDVKMPDSNGNIKIDRQNLNKLLYKINPTVQVEKTDIFNIKKQLDERKLRALEKEHRIELESFAAHLGLVNVSKKDNLSEKQTTLSSKALNNLGTHRFSEDSSYEEWSCNNSKAIGKRKLKPLENIKTDCYSFSDSESESNFRVNKKNKKDAPIADDTPVTKFFKVLRQDVKNVQRFTNSQIKHNTNTNINKESIRRPDLNKVRWSDPEKVAESQVKIQRLGDFIPNKTISNLRKHKRRDFTNSIIGQSNTTTISDRSTSRTRRNDTENISYNDKKNIKSYSMQEDMAILKFVQTNDNKFKVNGNSLWKDYQALHPLQCSHVRSFHSLRNRYLKNILPSLVNYNITTKEEHDLKAAAYKGTLNLISKRVVKSKIKPVHTASTANQAVRKKLANDYTEKVGNLPASELVRSKITQNNGSIDYDNPVPSTSKAASTPIRTRASHRGTSPQAHRTHKSTGQRTYSDLVRMFVSDHPKRPSSSGSDDSSRSEMDNIDAKLCKRKLFPNQLGGYDNITLNISSH